MKYSAILSEILLLFLVTAVTLAIALGLIRWLAPTLLGIPADMVMVRSSREVVPFYENILSRDDRQSTEFLISDPIVGVRAQTLFPDLGSMGPHDLLGFRNLAVPNEADILVIGDSQTYGNNVVIWENWPTFLRTQLPAGTVVYSMATGGWGAVQYLYAFSKSLVLNPKIVIVAFYTGNDAIETVNFALSSDRWKPYLGRSDVAAEDVPAVKFPPPDNEHWQVKFRDGTVTGFTPAIRLFTNMKHPAVDLGYEIMLDIASDIAKMAHQVGIQPVFTIIPTKEYVYLKKIRMEAVETMPAYESLIEAESARIAWFAAGLQSLDQVIYVDTAAALQEAAMSKVRLYPDDINGHPIGYGYYVISKAVAAALKGYVHALPQGLVVSKTVTDVRVPVYIRNAQFWLIEGDTEKLLKAREYTVVENLRFSGLTMMGRVPVTDLERYLDGSRSVDVP